MRGVDDEDGVKFETDRVGLDVPNAGQHQGGQDFAIGKPATNAGRDFFEQFVPWSLLEKANERFDIRFQRNQPARQFGFRSRYAREASEK
jgi:hypothetical protein